MIDDPFRHDIIEWLVLLAYGLMAIAGTCMVVGYFPAVRDLRKRHVAAYVELDRFDIRKGRAGLFTRLVQRVPLVQRSWALRWCKSYTMALALTEKGIFLTAMAGYRTAHMLIDGAESIGPVDVVLFAIIMGIADGSRRQVRAGSMTDLRTIKPPYKICVVLSAAWVAFVLILAITRRSIIPA